MTTGTRKSGFSSLGPISWGAHLCHFYESRGELLSVTAAFLHAGLANREVGIWVAPALLGPDKARHMLTRAMPALAEYADSGQLQILDGAQLYAPPKAGFNGGATVSLWSAAINDALGRGFEGLRVAGDAVCNENTDWAALVDYEATLKQKFAARPIIGLCTYCVQQLRAAQQKSAVRFAPRRTTEAPDNAPQRLRRPLRDRPLSSQAVQMQSRSNAKASASVFTSAAPSLQRGMLFEEVPADWLHIVRELDCVSLHASHRYLRASRRSRRVARPGCPCWPAR